MSLVVYENEDETLVTTSEFEEAFLREWFTNGGRDVDDYDRSAFENVVEITTRVRISGDRCLTA